MSNIEHSVGIHDSTWYSLRSLKTIEQNAVMAKNAGADFFVHMPGWKDILIGKESYNHLSLEAKFVDDSWWIDRIVELVTPLPDSKRLMFKNIAISMAYPIYPLSKILTKHELDVNPETSLIRRWPVFDSKDPVQIKRNNVIKLMSPKVVGSREVLDVHSVNIGLTAEELLEWQKQKQGRRLMISALMVDERLEKYNLSQEDHSNLINPLVDHVSAINLKIGDLKDQTGYILMTEKEITKAISEHNTRCLYAYRLKQLSETVGSKTDSKRIDWIIKVKPEMADGSSEKDLQTNSFLHKYIDYVRDVIQK
jgi:hypothetical protein